VCGVAGLIGRLDDRSRHAVEAMSCALEHRGPDASHLWSSSADAEGWGCILGHRRLSILDLSDVADQPMSHPDSGETLVYNGELYNFETLRKDLQAAGQQLLSTGDTEVLLRLLSARGVDALPALRGMFAFGLWDPVSRRLLLARDTHGIKPLYVYRNPDPGATWSLAFASELRALLSSGLVPRRLDPAAVASVVWNGFVTGPGTAVRGVEQLSPGSYHHYDGKGRRVAACRYGLHDAPAPTPPTTPEQLREVLARTVSEHLVSDVPLGVFLSSGVDSSAVANLAAAAAPGPLQTFTLSFETARHNESREAGAIAAAIGTQHHDILLSDGEFRQGLEAAIQTIDQPTFDGLNSMYMARAVRQAGIKVALVGTGGDELFGGYESFRQLPRLMALAGRPHVPSRVRGALAGVIDQVRRSGGPVPAQTRWAKLSGMVAQSDDLLALYQLGYALFLPRFQDRLLLDGLPTLRNGLRPELADELRADISGLDPLSALSRLEQRCFLGERLLRDSDAAAMSVSLELRLPLVDSVLTRSVEGLSTTDRYRPLGRKQILREAGLVGLDPSLFDRPKRGFVLPFDEWLKGPLRDRVDDVLRDRAACERAGLQPDVVAAVWDAFLSGSPGLYWSRVWALYVLIAWADVNGVSI
jgi:asparagine synthase (glutamine-hydrolysing)